MGWDGIVWAGFGSSFGVDVWFEFIGCHSNFVGDVAGDRRG
jgi:hypothetical protein